MGNRRPRGSRGLETVAESCAVTDGPSKETSRLLARLGRAVLAEGARLWHDFPEIRPRHALLADRTGRTSERRAARSCSLILTAIPSPPRMLRARDRRGPVVILPGTRGVAPGSDEMPNTEDATRRDGSGKEKKKRERVERFRGFAGETTRRNQKLPTPAAARADGGEHSLLMFDTTTPP